MYAPPYFKPFLQAMLEAVEFTDMGPDDEAHGHEMSEEMQARLHADALSFWFRAAPFVWAANTDDESYESAARRAGHDFWLTRNEHGSGFWDRDWSEPYGDILTKMSKCYGQLSVVVDDMDEANIM